MDSFTQVADSLLGIEAEMRRLQVWSSTPPSPQALRSTQPFCIDTLEFTEWLQFIFLPRMKDLVEQGESLPTVSGIAPMAEEHFNARPENAERLIRELETIDRLLSR
ncbi:MAG: YqcC family protein [Marinobacter sp.]|uniref:YqcC family protein n=1 Tax=Marinobacter sp. TaxID=50741 RepID=UPI00299DEA5C|nr:YqcC family protein [Marinobacter sp.]MDX1635777.1 YqcC family protein [Marinobacter sp.]